MDFAWAVHAGLAYNVTSEAEAKKAYIHCWSLGGGLEVMVMPKAFLRAEYARRSVFTEQRISHVDRCNHLWERQVFRFLNPFQLNDPA